jgi:hypothetical protein
MVLSMSLERPFMLMAVFTWAEDPYQEG